MCSSTKMITRDSFEHTLIPDLNSDVNQLTFFESKSLKSPGRNKPVRSLHNFTLGCCHELITETFPLEKPAVKCFTQGC